MPFRLLPDRDIVALVVAPDSLPDIRAWLAEHGATSHLDGDILRVLDGNHDEGHVMVSVPFGDCLARDDDAMWRRVPAVALDGVR